MQNLRKTDFWFEKWHEFRKFSSEALESVKIGIFMRSFCPDEKIHELQFYRGVVSNDTEEWWKIWRGTLHFDLSFKNWHKEFDKFWLGNSKVSRTYTLMGWFWPKYIIFELKRYRGAIFHGTRVWCKIWRNTVVWKMTWGIWQNFTRAHKIIKIETFIGSFYTK